ncbi:tti2 family domain-containing protein [Hirsutella rhossiliensis]|uniref:Tti2 family domain-containing protein n=1 Tax=Hirsutella rhossiliensis TaxID=111463 RepID=A0A9P8SGV1_9HYPO|nr:tti2 family domain-containing protein [Hirsutella rhossiliensis]KAH0960336.1 tti2 family domain-containing protein [Hirsutella rhossiliensis]
MLELALSPTNSERLHRLVQEAPPSPGRGGEEAPKGARRLCFTEAAKGLSRAADERSRHDAVLQLVATLLPQPPCLHQESEQAADALSLVRALLDIARPLGQATDNRYATHALVAELVLAALELLSRSGLDSLDDQALVLIVAYTDVHDPWTTQPSACLATGLVAPRLSNGKLIPFIVGPVLQAYIRPIFSQSGGTVLRSGRPVQTRDAHQSSLERPRWKEQDPFVVSVFRWAVDNADTPLIAGNWPLFLPVLLTLIEDPEVSVRENGLEILIKFLQMCPPEMLLPTGLGALFEDAIFPSLLSLPSSVEAQNCITTLCLAYDVLLQLARADREPRHQRKRRLLDRLIRDGILAGHLNTSTHAVVIETLMHYVATAVDRLGIFATKHLEILLQNIDSIMTDPFAANASGRAYGTGSSHYYNMLGELAQSGGNSRNARNG